MREARSRARPLRVAAELCVIAGLMALIAHLWTMPREAAGPTSRSRAADDGLVRLTRDLGILDVVTISIGPYRFLVEQSPRWEPAHEAAMLAEALIPVRERLLAEEGHWLGPVDVANPSTVVLVLDTAALENYAATHGLTAPRGRGLFDVAGSLLVLQRELPPEDARHLAIHQVLRACSGRAAAIASQTAWLDEGLALRYASSIRRSDGAFVPTPGRLTSGVERVLAWGWDFTARWDLLTIAATQAQPAGSCRYEETGLPLPAWDVTRNSRDRRGGTDPGGMDGWLLIAFLKSFDLQDDGTVIIDPADEQRRGRYAPVWERFTDGLSTHGSAHEAFLEAARVRDLGIPTAMTDQFAAYPAFIWRKMFGLRHQDQGRLLRWDHYANRRGQHTGRREDDQLFAR